MRFIDSSVGELTFPRPPCRQDADTSEKLALKRYDWLAACRGVRCITIIRPRLQRPPRWRRIVGAPAVSRSCGRPPSFTDKDARTTVAGSRLNSIHFSHFAASTLRPENRRSPFLFFAVADPKILKKGEDDLSVPSSFTANAQNGLTEKGGFLKKNRSQSGAAAPTPSL